MSHDTLGMTPAQRQASSLNILAMPDPSHLDLVYATSNSEYRGHWQDGTGGHTVSETVPRISDILACKPTIRKPVRPLQTTAKCVLAKQIEQARKDRDADKVLSADVLPKKYPVESQNFNYPENPKHGGSNPLYYTSSQAYGSEMPMPHQITDRFFPSTNLFTKGFVETKPRYTGLNTKPVASKIHSELDQFY